MYILILIRCPRPFLARSNNIAESGLQRVIIFFDVRQVASLLPKTEAEGDEVLLAVVAESR